MAIPDHTDESPAVAEAPSISMTASTEDKVDDSANTSPLLRPIDSPVLMSRSTSSSGSPSEFTLRDDPFSGMTLVDLLVSMDAHFDLLSRRVKEKLPGLRETIPQWKVKAAERFAARSKLKQELGSASDRVEREVTRFRLRVNDRLKRLDARWNEAKTVSLRERMSFCVGVMNVLLTALAIGLRPHWIPLIYTAQASYFLPLRIHRYRKLSYHYFLFDLCYCINGLTLAWMWLFPSNAILFEACYTLSHGPLATAIATWRNSLVFHSVDKVTSLFVHIYPPLVLMMLRHSIAGAEVAYPALSKLPTLHVWRSLAVSSSIYLLWQVAYYYGVIVARKEKIEKHGRVTSFTFLLNDKKGAIGKLLHKIPPARREFSFMAAQLVYTVLTVLPSIYLYDSERANALYLLAFFGVAVHNGSTFYLEVFGRRFEKEPIKLQKELEELQQEYNKAAETGRFPLSRSNSHYGTSTPTTAADAEATGDGEKEDALLTRTQSAPIEVLDVKEDASFHDDDREKKDK